MTDQPTGDEGPIKPEVVRRGAAARKRRPEPEAGDAEADATPTPTPTDRPVRVATGRVFRMGCVLLIAVGGLELFVASTFGLDPDEARCKAARLAIDEANDDDEEFNDVALPEGADDADDLNCSQAIDLAGQIPPEEDEEADGTFTEASAFRTQGLIFGALGIAHGVTGFLTLRTRRKAIRTAALIFAAIGILVPVLGIVSLLTLAFVVFALAFSTDAKAIFGGGSGFLRPRVPPAS